MMHSARRLIDWARRGASIWIASRDAPTDATQMNAPSPRCNPDGCTLVPEWTPPSPDAPLGCPLPGFNPDGSTRPPPLRVQTST